MTSPEERSARWSDRVEEPPAVRPGERPAAAITAAESLSSVSTPQTPPTRPTRRPEGQRAQRVSRRRLERLAADLSPREQGILTDLDRFRFLTTGQLEALHFTSHATEAAAGRICRRVLARLDSLGVIAHLERRIGGIRAGSASYVWRVGPVGDRLLMRASAGDAPRRRRKEPSLRYLDHCLAVADVYLALRTAARNGRLELTVSQTEPACWRPYLGPGGAPETLKPDLYAVTASGDYEDHWFIEMDRGTESLPTLLGKCGQYVRYRRAGREQTALGLFPVVVWVLPDEARLGKLAAALGRTRDLDPDLFRLTTMASFADTIAGGAA